MSSSCSANASSKRRSGSFASYGLGPVTRARSKVAIALATWLTQQLQSPLLAATLTAALCLPLALFAARWVVGPVLSLFRALGGTVSAYRDSDFSFGTR